MGEKATHTKHVGDAVEKTLQELTALWQKHASELLQDLETRRIIELNLQLLEDSQTCLQQAMQGMQRFKSMQFHYDPMDHEVIWQEGGSKLLAYGDRRKQPIFIIPSLINRAYIFDLTPELSMVRYLVEQGLCCYLLDWGEPGETEQGFTLCDYVRRLKRAYNIAGQSIVVGYCMGGMLALALAQSRAVKGLALLATPWDFHHPDVSKVQTALAREWLATLFAPHDVIPAHIIYGLFFLRNPWAVQKKFMRFAAMVGNDNDVTDFVAREHWVQDSVALTRGVAETCFIEWPMENSPGKKAWVIDDAVVNPAAVSVPSLVAIAQHDQVVPQGCAAALAKQLPGALTVFPPTGHVGLVAGKKAHDYTWLPLVKWCRSL